MQGADAKIPDETGVETGTIQVVQKILLAATAGRQTGGIRIISPWVNKCVDGFGTDGLNYQVVDPASTVTTIVWGGINPVGGAFAAGKGHGFDGAGEISISAASHRVVSAALYVQPEGSLANNSGEFTLFSFPYPDDSSNGSPQYNDYMNSYKASTIALNTNQAGVVRWYPFNRGLRDFKSFIDTDLLTLDEAGIEPAECVPNWEMGVVLNCDPDVSFRCTMVVNYEFIPQFNTLNILSVSPSPCDATETDMVERWTQDMPVASPAPQRVVAASPSAVTPQHGETDEGTGFGMFFNVIKELAPLVLALL